MTDARRRARERAATDEAGDLAARARALTERVRAGDLAPGRLRLAAYLGDPAARAALGADAPAPLSIEPPRGIDPPPDSEHAPAWLAMRIVDHWLADWATFDPDVPLAAALALGRFAIDRAGALGAEARAAMREALAAAERCLDAPDDADARARCAAAVQRAWPGEPPEALPERLAFLAAIAPLAGGARRGLVGRWLDEAILAWGTVAVRDAIAAGVLPWALR